MAYVIGQTQPRRIDILHQARHVDGTLYQCAGLGLHRDANALASAVVHQFLHAGHQIVPGVPGQRISRVGDDAGGRLDVGTAHIRREVNDLLGQLDPLGTDGGILVDKERLKHLAATPCVAMGAQNAHGMQIQLFRQLPGVGTAGGIKVRRECVGPIRLHFHAPIVESGDLTQRVIQIMPAICAGIETQFHVATPFLAPVIRRPDLSVGTCGPSRHTPEDWPWLDPARPPP